MASRCAVPAPQFLLYVKRRSVTGLYTSHSVVLEGGVVSGYVQASARALKSKVRRKPGSPPLPPPPGQPCSHYFVFNSHLPIEGGQVGVLLFTLTEQGNRITRLQAWPSSHLRAVERLAWLLLSPGGTSLLALRRPPSGEQASSFLLQALRLFPIRSDATDDAIE